MSKTSIKIDYDKCGRDTGIDPRTCTKCLKICDPAVFLMHQPTDIKQEDVRKPQIWQITAVWLSLCTRCKKCEKICPEQAISVQY